MWNCCKILQFLGKKIVKISGLRSKYVQIFKIKVVKVNILLL